MKILKILFCLGFVLIFVSCKNSTEPVENKPYDTSSLLLFDKTNLYSVHMDYDNWEDKNCYFVKDPIFKSYYYLAYYFHDSQGDDWDLNVLPNMHFKYDSTTNEIVIFHKYAQYNEELRIKKSQGTHKYGSDIYTFILDFGINKEDYPNSTAADYEISFKDNVGLYSVYNIDYLGENWYQYCLLK